MRRLYLQIYLAFAGILVVFTLLVWIAFALRPEGTTDQRMFEGLASLFAEVLPGSEAPPEELQAAIEALGERFNLHFSMRASDGRLLASVGEPLPLPSQRLRRRGWVRSHGGRMAMAFPLPDGRWLLGREAEPHIPGPQSWLLGVLLLSVAIAIGAFPVVRRITRRLERLQTRVEALGSGELAARVEVEGNDEVAELARSFNLTADRIERLVEGLRRMLASASHELRSPLARMRVAVELLEDPRPELRERITRDIGELDALIGELLLASQLDAIDHLERTEPVDLLALVAEEASRFGLEVGGEPVTIQGDARMLRRLVRNLLENAERHGDGSALEVSVSRAPGRGAQGALLCVADRGPGVPEWERERIFQPFYRPAGVRESGQGVGLGLALVRQIARHHAGKARCRPREGGGTVFEVELGARPLSP